MTVLRYRSRIKPLVGDDVDGPAFSELDAPDRRDGRIYDCPPELQLAVEVALTTGRPLLLRGEPGSGKSSLASFVARSLGWRYYEHVVTSATRAQDLLWRFDALRRLRDANAEDQLDDHRYVEPGVLWWAFAPESAPLRGAAEGWDGKPAQEPYHDMNETRDRDRAVVLIDELDKADPDVPNGLLVPLASTTFRVDDLGIEVSRSLRPADTARADPLSRLLVVITTNEERDLPPAFLRRCVDYTLPEPDVERLVRIARLHLESEGHEVESGSVRQLWALARRVDALRTEARALARRAPSTAEYLDAVRACRALEVRGTRSAVWKLLEDVTLAKRTANEATNE